MNTRGMPLQTALPLPGTLVRSALFSAHKVVQDTASETKVLAIQGEYTLTRKGPPLGVGERDVWAALVGQLPTENWPTPLLSAPGATLNTTLKAIGAALGYTEVGGNTRLSIISRLNRLYDTDVLVTSATHNVRARLISKLSVNTKTGVVQADISADFAGLFKQSTAVLRPDILQQLTKKPLASWLYGYFQSHVQPYRMSVERYHALSGSTTASASVFKQNLVTALSVLVDIGYLKSWEIDKFNNVLVTKAGTRKAVGFKGKVGEPGVEFDETAAREYADKINAAGYSNRDKQKRLRAERRDAVEIDTVAPSAVRGGRSKKPTSSK